MSLNYVVCMASNAFGRLFRITTWGESHGKAMGVVIDGCPAGIEITEEEINVELARRSPGTHPHTSPRKESDRCEILSGIYEGKTTGTPISIMIPNRDADESKYEPIRHLLRPGHANYTYLQKYGIFDGRGGGRASARETVGRVAASAIAKKFLAPYGIHIHVTIDEVAGFQKADEIEAALAQAKTEGDTLGAILRAEVTGLPPGLGDPVYDKLEARLADAMLSIPATKGFEIGEGFAAARMRGSEHNDAFCKNAERVETATNHAGGTLGGISTGMPLYFRIAFKPISSICRTQETLTLEGEPADFQLPEGSRHDPCVAIRAIPIVEAMTVLVITDAILFQRLVKV